MPLTRAGVARQASTPSILLHTHIPMSKKRAEPPKTAAQLAREALMRDTEDDLDERELFAEEERPRARPLKRVHAPPPDLAREQRLYGYRACRCTVAQLEKRKCVCGAERANLETASADPAAEVSKTRELAILRGLEMAFNERDLRKYDRKQALNAFEVSRAEMETAEANTAQRFWWMVAGLRVGLCCHKDTRYVAETLTIDGDAIRSAVCDAFLADPRTLHTGYSKAPEHAREMRDAWVRRVRECRVLPDERLIPYIARVTGEAFVVFASDRATFYTRDGRNQYDVLTTMDVFRTDLGVWHSLVLDRAEDGSVCKWTAARDAGRLQLFREQALRQGQ